VLFRSIHLVVAGTRLRDALVRAIGEGPYMGLFSLASVGGLVWLVFAFAQGRGEAWNIAYWGVTPGTRHVQIALQLIAMTLIVVGQTTPNPTSVKREAVLDRPDAVQGIVRITRHPFLWGIALWATGHLLVNGDRASIVLFGTMLLLAVFGTASIDAKRKRALGDKWDAFAAQTSNVPFGAVVSGRQPIKLGEIGWWRLALGVGIWAALLFAHPYAFGVNALP
jgi:uncharacterized membrane protein